VRALAISPDGSRAISGSFDTSAIRWSLARNVAEQVMRFHDDAVNAVVWLKDGRIATAGADAHIAILVARPAARRQGARRPWRPDRRAGGVERRPMLLRRRGITRFAYGRSSAARRACWKAIRRPSTSVAFTPDGRNV